MAKRAQRRLERTDGRSRELNRQPFFHDLHDRGQACARPVGERMGTRRMGAARVPRAVFRQRALALLNGIAGPLMVLVREVLWEDLLLRVARLTDPVRTGKHQNLTLQQIPEFFDDQPEKHRDLTRQVQAADEAADFARDWRNRSIGHKDLRHSLNREAKPLERASLRQVDEALAAVHRVLATIAGYDQAGLSRRVAGSNAAEGFFYRTAQLVEAVQFVDELVDPDGTSKLTDQTLANAFLEKLAHEPNLQDYERVVELRAVARSFPRQNLNRPLRAKMNARRGFAK